MARLIRLSCCMVIFGRTSIIRYANQLVLQMSTVLWARLGTATIDDRSSISMVFIGSQPCSTFPAERPDTRRVHAKSAMLGDGMERHGAHAGG